MSSARTLNRRGAVRKPSRAHQAHVGSGIGGGWADADKAPHVPVLPVEEEGAVPFAADAGEGVATPISEELASPSGAFRLLQALQAVVDDEWAARLLGIPGRREGQ